MMGSAFPPNTSLSTTGGQIAADGTITVGGSVPFSANDLVTYHKAGQINFNSNEVNADQTPNGFQPDPGLNEIYVGRPDPYNKNNVLDSGISTGDALYYSSSGATLNTSIGNLVNGGIYYAIRVSSTFIKLADSYCNAVGFAGDSSCVFDSNPAALEPDAGTDATHINSSSFGRATSPSAAPVWATRSW